MKLFEVEQIKAWDLSTINSDSISSADLMERAGYQCALFIHAHFQGYSIQLMCGTGNNGGDGLVIARLLSQWGCDTKVCVAGNRNVASEDFNLNYARLETETNVTIEYLESNWQLEAKDHKLVIIDCLFGTGLNRPVEGLIADCIATINESGVPVVSIDVPSGMNVALDEIQKGPVVIATHTLTFQTVKRPFLYPENEKYVGEWHIMDIRLSSEYLSSTPCQWFYVQSDDIQALLHSQGKFIHKNSKGHLQLIAGSIGKMGAAILASRAAMRAGVGVLTSNIPSCGTYILQQEVPEAMCVPDEGLDFLKSAVVDNHKSALAIGPGIGKEPDTSRMLQRLLGEISIPLVADADALNLIVEMKLLSTLQPETILTPHVGEFERLFGVHENHFHRVRTQREMSAKYRLVIVLKGAHTSISLPNGELYFNSTGNRGMATAGCGDVLTGVIGSLLAQGYSPHEAAILGVYLHGLAGDLAAEKIGMDGLMAGDIVEHLPHAWKKIKE